MGETWIEQADYVILEKRFYDELFEVRLLAGKKRRETTQARFLEWIDSDHANASLGRSG